MSNADPQPIRPAPREPEQPPRGGRPIMLVGCILLLVLVIALVVAGVSAPAFTFLALLCLGLMGGAMFFMSKGRDRTGR